MSNFSTALGIDFGGTSVKLGIVHGDKILATSPSLPTAEYGDPQALLADLLKHINELRTEHPDIRAIGVGVPGFVNFKTGAIHRLTNVRGWASFPLKEELEAATKLPVTIENDANCMGYAEWRLGEGHGFTDFLTITMGTGIGGCVFANGGIVRGSQYGAGEIGQASIEWRGIPANYGNKGALEKYIGNREITQRGVALYGEAGITKTTKECTPRELSQAAREGDKVALALWNEVAEMLATGLSNYCWLLNPQAIIIGGGVAKAGDVLFEPLQRHLNSRLSEPFKESLQILRARFSNDAGMIGAATIALEHAK